jgi:CubicO group peptidase (beta-lactamase class C family)
MVYPPDTHFNYSNLGYSLLGQVVTEVSGLEYVDYVRENILAPLGLDATTPYPPPRRPGLQVAKGYGCHQRTGQRPGIVAVNPGAVTPALGFYSSVEDLAKLAMWQLRALDGEDAKVLRRETLEEMSSVHWPDPAWGLGFTIWNMGEMTFVGHQGGCPGYKSQIIICPEEKIAVVVMVNATDAPQFTLAFRTFEIMAPVLTSSSSDMVEANAWDDYIGFYSSPNTWSDAEVLSWKGGLALMWVPGGNPDPVGSLVTLTRVEGEVFRQVNANGELGKHYIFRKDADGNVVSLKFNNNLLDKVTR